MNLGASIILLLTVLPAVDSAGPITIHSHAPFDPLQMACDRLAEYLRDCPEEGSVLHCAAGPNPIPRWARKVMPSARSIDESTVRKTKIKDQRPLIQGARLADANAWG